MLRFLIMMMVTAQMFGTPLTAQAESLSIATGEYPPFTDSKAPGGGSVNAVVQKMAERAGMEATFKYMPWARGLELTRAGRFEATSFWYFSEERSADFIHVGPIFEDRLVFFHLKETDVPRWTKLEDLSALKIGAVTGYTLTPELWDLAEQDRLQVEVAPNDETNFRKLMAGRIDLYPMSLESGWQLVDRIFDADQRARLTTIEKPLTVTNGYLLVSRAAPNAEEIAGSLEHSLQTLNSDQSIKQSAVMERSR